jgi:acetolactate synthase-1/2/3 large subunit
MAVDEITTPSSRGMTGAEALVSCLQQTGVRYVFGMSGHANLAVLDALAGAGLQFISVPHEQLAVHAADCYHRATGELGVVLTTLGPGITNTASALTDAVQDCSALLLLAGDVPQSTAGRDAYQELDVHNDSAQIDVIRPLVKRAWRITHPDQVIPYLIRAYATAMAPRRGPVMIDLPMDVMSMTGTFDTVNLAKRTAAAPPAANAVAVAEAGDLLARSKRPLIYCGGGAVQAGACQEVAKLAHLLGAPVVTSLSGQTIMPTTDPLFGGVTGSVGTPTGHGLAANADVVLTIGSRFSDMDASSRDPGFFFTHEAVQVIQVDIDATQIGRHFPVELGIIADAKQFLLQLTAYLSDSQAGMAADGRPSAMSGGDGWMRYLGSLKSDWTELVAVARASDETPLAVERVLSDIGRVVGDQPVNYLSGIGPRYLVAQHLERRRADAHFTASGSGTMGFAVPAALGVSLGRPGEPVIAIIGDGEFKSTSAALAMAVEYGIPVIWIVLNNYSYNVIELYQTKYFGRLCGSTFTRPDASPYSPDYALLASAYGVPGERIEDPDSFAPALAKALEQGGPAVLDVIVSRRPRLRATGHWEANRYLTLGWNNEAQDAPVGGFGDQEGHSSWRRSWDGGDTR